MKCCKCKVALEIAYMVGVSEEVKHLKDNEYCEACFNPVAEKYGLQSKQPDPEVSISQSPDLS